MANIIRCDRCGKEYNNGILGQQFTTAKRRWYDHDSYWKSKEYDLCPECTKQFERDFMRMKPDATQDDDAP